MADDRNDLKRLLEMGSTRMVQRVLDQSPIRMLQREIEKFARPRDVFEQAALGGKLVTGTTDAIQRHLEPSPAAQAVIGAQSAHGLAVPVSQSEFLTQAVAAGQRLANRQGSVFGHQADLVQNHQALFEQAGAYELGRSFAGLTDIAERLALRAGWQEPYLGSLETAFRVLGEEGPRPTGILAGLDTGKLRASMSWILSDQMFAAGLLDYEDEIPKVRPIIPGEDDFELPPPAPIHLTAKVTCAFCGETMLVTSINLHWHGPQEGILDLEVVPMCVECRRREREDPSYLVQAWKARTGPRLRVVDGGREGDGKSVATLRLVRDDDDGSADSNE